MTRISRRDFLKTSVAAGAHAGMGSFLSLPSERPPPIWSTLGKSDVKVTRLAFGTGSRNGITQRQLGQDEFTRQVRYAYDHGIRFFETSESYVTPQMLGIALKGIPRDTYQLMTQGHHLRRHRTREEARRNAQGLQHRLLRHHAPPLAARRQSGRTKPSAGRTPSSKHSTTRSSSPAAPPSTACPRCAGCPATSGSRSP